jgi:Ice-binding-like
MRLCLSRSRLAAGLAVLPLAALLAVACGGSDTIDDSDGSAPDGVAPDGLAPDAPFTDDAPITDDASPDAVAPDATLADSGTSDASAGDAEGSDADAGQRELDGAASDAGASHSDGGADANEGPGADASRDANEGPDADASRLDSSLPDLDSSLLDSSLVDSSLLDADVIDAGLDAELGDGGPEVLGSASTFEVLGGQTITFTTALPLSTLGGGNVGLWPGAAVVDLPAGQPPAPWLVYIDDPAGVAKQAQADLTIAYNKLAGLPCLTNMTSVDLGGKTLPPAVYCFNTSAQLTGALVLDAQGNPNATWVIQTGSTLTTASNSTVNVIGGGSACNVYWQIGSSATLGTGTRFMGSILAAASITLTTGTSIPVGRALAQVAGAVTFDSNAISSAACQ